MRKEHRMAKFKNVSPLGALEIPVLGRTVEAGEVFEVSKDMTDYFAAQPANFKNLSAGRAKAKGQTETSGAPGKGVAPSGADDSTDEEKEEGR